METLIRYSKELILGSLLIFLMTGATTPDIIYWTENHRLSWDDFEGDPRFDDEDVSAITSSGIIHYQGCESNLITYKIQAYFEKQESWVKQEARTNHHLAHEQIHFDITELHTRRLRRALVQRQFQCGEEAEFETFVSAYIENWKNDQQMYDVLSQHSIDKKVQREWFYKVNMELSLLEGYTQ